MLRSRSLKIKLHLNYEKAQHLAVGDVVRSEDFSAGGCLWRINCYPRGDKIDGNNEHLSIYLQLVSKSTIYVINGMFTIMCKFKVIGDNTKLVPQPSNLATHLSHLLDRTLGADVSFIVGSETFSAHRAVLAARSPVFSAEFFWSMADATMPSITLQDINPAAFKVKLQFIYTDALPPDDEFGGSPVEMMLHLLATADRYALDRLKVMCELKLWENVSVDTVASVLVCAETYSCPKLKTKCMEFFAVKENFMKAAFTDGFAMLLQQFPALADELGRRLGI